MKPGDIVVREVENHPDRELKLGDITIIKEMDGHLNIKLERFSLTSNYAKEKFRFANEREIAAYKQGITNINNIPADFMIDVSPLIFN